MESTSVPGRMQISEATYELVCDDDSFEWDERGSVVVKGKGELMTYLLRSTGAAASAPEENEVLHDFLSLTEAGGGQRGKATKS